MDVEERQSMVSNLDCDDYDYDSPCYFGSNGFDGLLLFFHV